MTTAPPDADRLLAGSGGASPATQDAELTLRRLMWSRVGWPAPNPNITEITRNIHATQRWRRRQPLVVPPGKYKGTWYYSPTNTADMPDGEKHALNLWKQRQTALGVALDPGLQDLIISHQGDKDELDRLVQRAMNRAKADENADKGTARHKAAELRDFGLDTGPLSPRMQADLDAYTECTRGLQMVLGEMIVVDDPHKLCGTFDRVAWYEPDKCYYIVDLKPPDSGFGQGARAIQFKIYADSWLYDWNRAQGLLDRVERQDLSTADLAETNLRAPLPQPLNREYAIMVHVPRGGTGRAYCARVNIGEGATGRRIAAEMRRWQDRNFQQGLVEPFEPEIVPFSPQTPPLVLDLGKPVPAPSSPPVLRAVPHVSSATRAAHTAPLSKAAERVLGAAPTAADDAPLEPPTRVAEALKRIDEATTLTGMKNIYRDYHDLWTDPAAPVPTAWRKKRPGVAIA